MRTSLLRTFKAHQQWVWLVIGLLAFYVLLPQLHGFDTSWREFTKADLGWAAGALMVTLGSYLAAAAVYSLLALRPLPYGRTLWVQFAGMFVNRLLPGGSGGMGLNYLYLRHQRFSVPQSVGVVALSNIIGFIGHLLLLAAALVIFRLPVPALHLRLHGTWLALAVLLFAIIVFAALRNRRLSRYLRQLNTDIGRQLVAYRRHPGRLTGALLASVFLTLCNVVALWACIVALHLTLGFLTVLIVFSVGVLAATATPTPGGLGGMEAGMVAGLVAYGVPAAAALAIVLLYRLISYWFMLVIGAAAFALASRRRFFS